jgi:hypothetical protein
LKLGSRKNVKSAVGALIDQIVEMTEETTGKALPPKMKKFLAAIVWDLIDFIDDVAVRRGRLEPKDVAIFAIKRVSRIAGVVDAEYAECASALVSAAISLYENFELFEASSEVALLTAEIPIVAAASLTVALGAVFSAGYDVVSAVAACSRKPGEVSRMTWFAIEYRVRTSPTLVCSA